MRILYLFIKRVNKSCMGTNINKDDVIDAFKNGFVVCHLKGQSESFNSEKLCDFMVQNMDSLLKNRIDLSEEPTFTNTK